MKRVIVALCSAAAILIGSVMMPMTAHAVTRPCEHQYRYGKKYVRTCFLLLDLHPLLVAYGANGPIYDTCDIRQWVEESYPQCSVCNCVDFADCLTKDERSDRIHTNCQCPLYNG